jgi:hypothetical protein
VKEWGFRALAWGAGTRGKPPPRGYPPLPPCTPGGLLPRSTDLTVTTMTGQVGMAIANGRLGDENCHGVTDLVT